MRIGKSMSLMHDELSRRYNSMCGSSLWTWKSRKRTHILTAIQGNTVFIAKKLSLRKLEINIRQDFLF